MLHLEHIGIAISDEPATVALFEALLNRVVYKSEAVPSEGVATDFLDVGSSKVELLRPTDAESPIARFLARHGPGLHHLAFEVDDIDEAFSEMTRRGLQIASPSVSEGADGKRVFFLHPRSTSGVLVEFCQSTRSVLEQSEIGVGEQRYALGEGGRESEPHLLLLAPSLNSVMTETIARRFESTRRVLVLAPLAGTSTWPALDQLAECGMSPADVICTDVAGLRFLAAAGEQIGRSVAFLDDAPVRQQIWANVCALDSILCIGGSSSIGTADLERPLTFAVLPVAGNVYTSVGVQLAMPMIVAHLSASS